MKAFWTSLFAIASLTACSTPEAEPALDFEEIIATAKREVYGAIVFVKPIREDFRTGEAQRQEVFGSGVIISPDGLVITNHHVAEKAREINCVLFDKELVKARVLGLDAETDLALLKLEREEGAEPLPYARFAPPGETVEGQFVMALGSPFGFTRSISLGIISNSRRYLGPGTRYKYNLWYQTDADINPGNSGGPLVNTRGEIVGINTLGLVGTGIGFSIPYAVVQDVVARLERDGQVIRAWTGIELQALRDFSTNTFSTSSEGAVIAHVEEPSPASEAGIATGDILLSVDGRPTDALFVEDLPDLARWLADLKPEAPTVFKIRRMDDIHEIEVVPSLKSRFEGEDFECRRWNMTITEISRWSTPSLYFQRREGVFVRGVKFPGNAANAGLRRQDILVSIDGVEITSLEQVKQLYATIVSDENRETKVKFEVLRGSLRTWIVLDYSRDFDQER